MRRRVRLTLNSHTHAYEYLWLKLLGLITLVTRAQFAGVLRAISTHLLVNSPVKFSGVESAVIV